MKRTTIMLPQSLRIRAIERARGMGISLGELIRKSLEIILSSTGNIVPYDPLFDDNEFFTGEAPKDLSKNHDYYLYGDSK